MLHLPVPAACSSSQSCLQAAGQDTELQAIRLLVGNTVDRLVAYVCAEHNSHGASAAAVVAAAAADAQAPDTLTPAASRQDRRQLVQDPGASIETWWLDLLASEVELPNFASIAHLSVSLPSMRTRRLNTVQLKLNF